MTFKMKQNKIVVKRTTFLQQCCLEIKRQTKLRLFSSYYYYYYLIYFTSFVTNEIQMFMLNLEEKEKET